MTESSDNTDPARHCFRGDGCHQHEPLVENLCCCCGQPPEAHSGCDCE